MKNKKQHSIKLPSLLYVKLKQLQHKLEQASEYTRSFHFTQIINDSLDAFDENIKNNENND